MKDTSWLLSEENTLQAFLRVGVPRDEIAKRLNRSIGSVHGKITRMKRDKRSCARELVETPSACSPDSARTPTATSACALASIPVPAISTERLEQIQKEAATEAAIQADERVRLLQRELESAKRLNATLQAKSDIVISAVREIFEDRKVAVTVPPPPKLDPRNTREEQPVLCLGDIHFGHYHQGGKHTYCKEEAKRRLHLAVDKFILTARDRRCSAKIEHLHLFLLGDVVEGENMRPGHAWSVEGPVIKQAVFWAPEALASVVVKLLGEFRRITIKGVGGNHGRCGPPKTDSHPESNWDRVAYEVTRLMVNKAILQGRNPARLEDISWDIPTDRTESHDGDDWYAIDFLFDWCCCLIHGEDLRGKGWGGLPFYGIERIVRRYADIVDDPIDYMFLGHVHTDAIIPSNYRAAFVNGAVDSSSTFVRKQLVSATTPSQKAVFFDAEHGPVSHHTFYLSDHHKPHGQRIMDAMEKRRVE